MESLHFIFTMLLQILSFYKSNYGLIQQRTTNTTNSTMDLKDIDVLCTSNVHCLTFDLRIYLSFDQTFNFDETFIQVLKLSHDDKNARFCCSFSYLELCSEDSLFFLSQWWRGRVFFVCILLQYSSVQE